MAALDAVVLDEVGVVFTLTLTHHLLLPRRVLHHYPFYALSSNNGPIISPPIIINHNHQSSIKADVLFPPPPRTTSKFRPKGGLRGGRDQSGKKTKKKEADCPTTKLLKFLAIYNEREDLQVILVVV